MPELPLFQSGAWRASPFYVRLVEIFIIFLCKICTHPVHTVTAKHNVQKVTGYNIPQVNNKIPQMPQRDSKRSQTGYERGMDGRCANSSHQHWHSFCNIAEVTAVDHGEVIPIGTKESRYAVHPCSTGSRTLNYETGMVDQYSQCCIMLQPMLQHRNGILTLCGSHAE